MVFLEQPQGFNPKIEVAGCFVEHNGSILFMHRQDTKPQGNTWSVPGGKINPGETAVATMRRELFEETNYDVPEEKLSYFRKFFVRYPEFDFIYHVFHHFTKNRPQIILNDNEHKDYRWITPNDALLLDLIPGEAFCIKQFFSNRLQL